MCNIDSDINNNSEENYVCALFLTASSMIQARLFIQAWEFLNNLQMDILDRIDSNNLYFFKILLEPHTNHMLLSSDDGMTRTATYLAKLELIKGICSFEHGHINAFLDSLKNCINIYYYNDYSELKQSISWTKNNEIASDKFYIQNFLITNGKRLVEILITLLEDQNEIITMSSLKVIEFILDYYPIIFSAHFYKLIKSILKLVLPTNNLIRSINNENKHISKILSYEKHFEENGIYFNGELIRQYFKINYNAEVVDNSEKKAISPIILKQINYTLDTLINNVEILHTNDILTITNKTNMFLLDLLSKDIDPIIVLNVIKLLKKLFENINTDLLELLNKGNNQINLTELIMKLVALSLKYKYENLNKLKYSELFEINEKSGIVSFILDKISEEFYLFNEREPYVDFIKWATSNLKIIIKQIKSTQNELFEFNTFYCYLLISLINYLLFNKNDLKIEITNIFSQKIHNDFINILSDLIMTLFEIEEYTLYDKNLLCLFELITDLFKKMSNSYKKFIYIDYGKLFIDQYKSLYKYIEKAGIYNENIVFLVKTLPLIELGEDEMSEVIQNIFISILNNFSNYYNEDIYELFNLLLDKIANSMDENMINMVIRAIINKYNYKGANFKQCSNKFFELLLSNEIYFKYMKDGLIQAIEIFSNNIEQHKDINKFKEQYLEFIEKLEFYKKYFEFLKDNSDTKILERDSKCIIYEHLKDSFDYDIMQIAKTMDENVIIKNNEIISTSFELILKYLGIMTNNGITDNDISYLLTIYVDKIFHIKDYLCHINKHAKNYYLLSENYRLLSKLSTNINQTFTLLRNDHSIIESVFIEKIQQYNNDILLCRIKLQETLFSTISLKDIPFKITTNELMNFIENSIIEFIVYINLNRK
jgi:hypothetical protein